MPADRCAGVFRSVSDSSLVMRKHSPRSAMRVSLDFEKPYLFGSAASIDVVFIVFSPRSLIARSCPVKIR